MAQSSSFANGIPLATALMLLTPAIAVGQATGTISGLVTDSTSAALPAVALEVTNRSTGLIRLAVTGSDGVYVVPLLPPGVYDVKALLAGFSTVVREGVRVSVSETARVNLTLAVGRLSAEVTVAGDAPLVETGNATLGIVIDDRRIVDLPLNGRSFAQLGTLVPGVVAPPSFLGGVGGAYGQVCSSARRTSLATVGRLERPFADASERSIYVTESFDETGSFVLVRPRGILGVGLGERPNDKPPGDSIQ